MDGFLHIYNKISTNNSIITCPWDLELGSTSINIQDSDAVKIFNLTYILVKQKLM